MCLLIVTRYIQEAGPTQGVGWIALSCTTASSDPAVKCDAIITCNNETAVNVELNTSLVHTTTQPCNITIKVTFRNNTTIILDQIMFTNVTPLIQHTATTTTGSGPTPRMPSTGKYFIHIYVYTTEFLLYTQCLLVMYNTKDSLCVCITSVQ